MGRGTGGSIGGRLEPKFQGLSTDDEFDGSVAMFRGSPSSNMDGAGLDGSLRRLRPVALKRLQRLMETAGQLPPEGYPGVLLPPLPIRFLADELGTRVELVEHLLSALTKEGMLQEMDGQYLIPNPADLTRSPLS